MAISLLYSNKGNYGTSSQDETNPVTVIDDEFPDPTIWLSFRDICPDDPDATITLYKESKSNILDKTGWLYDSEIHAGQSLLKRDFPMVDGLNDPAVRGALVTPAASEFIQIINVGLKMFLTKCNQDILWPKIKAQPVHRQDPCPALLF